jgi:Glycosyltransferase family 87
MDSVNTSEFVHPSTRRPIVGGVIRALLIAFALIGIPHVRRVIFNPPALTDLYPVWFGSRELLLHHRNPYSREISQEIQRAFYGAELGSGAHPDQQCCFAYPIYVALLLAPTVKSDFASLLLPALIFLMLLTVVNIVCWYTVTRRDARDLVVVIPLVLISPPVIQGLELRQSAMLVAALLAMSALLADRGHLTFSGISLALATIKPQMCIVPIAWMLLWAANGWASRKKLAIGFAATMAVLVGAGELLLPGWISQFLAQLRVYRNFAGVSTLELLYGRGIGLALTAIFIGALVWVMWRARRTSNFVPILAYVLAIPLVILPGLKSLLNLVLLIPGIFMLLSRFPFARAARRALSVSS